MANLPESPVWHDEIYRLEKRTLVVGGEPQFDEAGNPIGGYSNVPHKQVADRTQWLRERIGEKLQVVEDIDALRLVDPRLLYYGQFLSIVTYGSGQFNDGVVEYYYWDSVSQLPDDGYDVIKPNVPLVSGRWIRITNQTSDDIIEEMRQLLADSQAAAQQSLQYSQNAAQYAQQASQSAENAASYDILYQQYLVQTQHNVELSRAWAESDTPPDVDDSDSKSAKTWAGQAEEVINNGIASITDLQQEVTDTIAQGVIEISSIKDQATIEANRSATEANRSESQADRATIEANRAETIASQIATSPEAEHIFDTLAEATTAASSLPDKTLLLVVNDGNNNGNYTVKSGVPVKTEYQVVSPEEFEEFSEKIGGSISSLGYAVSLREKSQAEFLRDKFDTETLEWRDEADNIILGVPVTRNFHNRISLLENKQDTGLNVSYLFLRDKFDNGSIDFVDDVGNLMSGSSVDLYLLNNSNGGGSTETSNVSLDIDTIVSEIEVGDGVLTADGEPYSSLDSRGEFTSVITQYPKSVLANSTLTAYGSNSRVLAGGFTKSIIIPVGRRLTFLFLTDGQSLSVGGQGIPPLPFLTKPHFSTKLLMPGGEGMDVRCGSPSSGTQIPDDLTNFQSFQPFVSKAFATRGTTPIEATATRIAFELSKELGYVPEIVIMSVGWGGTGITDLGPGSIHWNNLLGRVQRVVDLQAAKGNDVYIPFATWYHGENDSSSTLYKSRLNTYQNTFQTTLSGITGQAQTTIPFVIRQPTGFFKNSSTGLQQCQAATAMYELCKEEPTRFIMGGTSQGVLRAPDQTHLQARGYSDCGEMDGLAWLRTGWSGNKTSGGVIVTNKTTSGLDVVWTMTEPVVIDNRLGDSPNLGFTAIHGDDGTDASDLISNVVVNGSQITVSFTALPRSGEQRALRYAINSERVIGNSNDGALLARGNIRAARVETSMVDGAALYDWVCHIQEGF